MKKTGIRYLFKTIRKNLISFIAVAFIAAISIAIYLGLQAGATATLMAGDQYFTANKLHSIEVRSSVGITPDDLDLLAAQDGVDAAEGGYSAMVMMDGEDEKLSIHALSLCDALNIPVVLEGALPAAANEVAIEEKFAMERGVSVGDSIRLESVGELTDSDFTVAAIINLPAYCCLNVADTRGMADEGLGSAAYYVVLHKAAFNSAYYFGRFPLAYVRSDELDALYDYSDEYGLKETAFIAAVEALNDRWTATGRSSAGDLRALSVLVDSIYGLSYVLSIIFVLVAVVVCHAAISRMIFEQRTMIGVQKALGFRTGEVIGFYMLYNTICAILGIVIGCLLGVFVVENIVVTIFGDEFALQQIPLILPWREGLTAAVVCIVIFLITTYMGCSQLSRRHAVELLRDEVPAAGKHYRFERWAGYRKMNLYSRTMIKNVLTDKSRMMTTIVGVVGCISLLVICIALKMGIENSSKVQFKDYFLYQNRLVINTKKGETDAFEAVLAAENISHTSVHDKLKTFRINGGQWESGHVVAVENPDDLTDFMVLEDIHTGTAVQVPSDGVLVSRKCAEIYHLSAGSTVGFMNAKGQEKTLKIAGVIEHYLPYPLFVTTADYYEKSMDETADLCVFLLRGDIDGLHEKVRGMDGFLSLKDNSDQAANADQVDMVIALCLALAAIMSLLVLLNQIVLHINRKARELAVMRINGYTLKETRAYVYKDNVILTIIGLLLGCGAGSGLAYLAIRIMEGEVNRYVRALNPIACLFGVVIGGLFAFIVNVIALRRIRTLNLTSVNSN